MNRTVVTIALIAGVALAATVGIYTRSNRYYLQSSGKTVYRIDKKTGKTWGVRGTSMYEIDDSADAQAKRKEQSLRDSAIRTAKSSYTLSRAKRNEEFIRARLRAKATGTEPLQTKAIRIETHGWEAERIGKELYTVTYTWDEGDRLVGYTFEVNTEFDIVKLVKQ